VAKKIKEAFKKPAEAKKEEQEAKETELSYQLALTSNQKTAVVDKMVAQLEESESSRAGWLAIREDSIRQYEGIKTPTSEPWPGHSNISTMVTTVACDLLHAKLFPMVWNEQSITWEGVEEHDIETSELNKTVMAWVSSVDMKLRDKVDDICQRLVVDGTVAIKLLWTTGFRYVTRKTKKLTYNSFMTGKFEYDVSVDYVREERCELDIRPLERVFIPFHSDTTAPRWEDDAEYILDERWYTLEELREMQAKGEIDKGVNLSELEGAMNELEQFKGTTKERMAAEGSNPPDPRKESYKLRCIEGYIKHAIGNDKIRKQCVFLAVVKPKFYLSGKALHDISRIGRRPWIIRPFLRRPGRVYGKGVPELVRHLHTLLDAIFNQGIDAGNRVIGGGGFYRPASGTNPRRLKGGPSMWIAVDDPKNDVYMPTYNISGLQWSSNEMRLVMELIERLTYLTPAMLGRETAQRPTARGTLAVIQQGESKFTLIGGRAQQIVCDMLTDIRQKYEENMPRAKWERIMGREGKLKDFPSVEYMAGMYEAKMQLDLTSIDLEGKRALAAMIYQVMAFDPFVQQSPAFMWEIRAQYLRAHRYEPVEKYIGPRPPSPNPKDGDDVFAMIEAEHKPDISKVDPTAVVPRLMELKRTERYERFTLQAKALFNECVRELQLNYVDRINKGMENMAQVSPFQGMGQGGPGGLNQPGPQAPQARQPMQGARV
jgi:hypothetical protein